MEPWINQKRKNPRGRRGHSKERAKSEVGNGRNSETETETETRGRVIEKRDENARTKEDVPKV